MNERRKKIIKKYYEYVITKIRLLYSQREFESNGVTVKYILEKHKKSSDLIIVFSSCTRKGIKARYNYIKTLSDIRVNKLFILDDFAADKRGSYYLGHDFTFCEEYAVKQLIDDVVKSVGAKKCIYCGSSKGGYSAINFGLIEKNAYIIAGGPQYYLASYLSKSGNIECLSHIIGEFSEEKMLKLDNYLERKIYDNRNNNSIIYLHYSSKEHTYNEHVRFLINKFEENGYKVEYDVATYENHSDIALFFPEYLVKTINNIIKNVD